MCSAIKSITSIVTSATLCDKLSDYSGKKNKQSMALNTELDRYEWIRLRRRSSNIVHWNLLLFTPQVDCFQIIYFNYGPINFYGTSPWSFIYFCASGVSLKWWHCQPGSSSSSSSSKPTETCNNVFFWIIGCFCVHLTFSTSAFAYSFV